MNHRKYLLITNHIKKMIKNINKILEYFVCEKFINQKFFTLRLDNMIFLGFEYKPKIVFKKIYKVCMSRDIVSLGIINVVDNLKQAISLSIECQEMKLKLSQTEDHSKTNVSISIYNNIIINTTSVAKNEQNTKIINEEIECINKVRYILLRKVMVILYKICKNNARTKNKKTIKLKMI